MTSYVRTQTIEHRIGADGSFTLRVTSPEVEIRASDDDVARVHVTFDIGAPSAEEADAIVERARFRVTSDERSLAVVEARGGQSGLGALARIFGASGASATRVQAEVPRHAEVTFDGVSAEVTATGLRGRQSYRTVSGDMVLEGVAGHVSVQGVSGDVSLRADAAMALDGRTVSGDLSAVAPRFEELRAVTVSGDVELEGALQQGPAHRVETVSGDLNLGLVGDLTLEVRGLSSDVDVDVPHRSEGSRDRRRYVVGSGGPELSFRSMSGDVSVGPARRAASTVAPPSPPRPPTPPAAPRSGPALNAQQQLDVLQALERGEIDVDEATRRLSGADR